MLDPATGQVVAGREARLASSDDDGVDPLAHGRRGYGTGVVEARARPDLTPESSLAKV